MTREIKYYTTQVCFQEIPDEISFTYFITNCPNRCPNCHSPHLRDDIGQPARETLDEILIKNLNRVSCILFMGGDDPSQVDSLISILRICRSYGFKTALYSGFELNDCNPDLLNNLDYIKTGAYIESLGGLKVKTTNQRLYKLIDGQIEKDITYLFWRNLDEDHC